MRRNNVVKIGQRLPPGTKKLFELDHSPNPNNDIIWDERGAEYFKEAEKYLAKVMIGVAITQRWLTAHVPVLFPWKEWAVNSPDLSEIENLFGDIQDIVDEKIRRTSIALSELSKPSSKS